MRKLWRDQATWTRAYLIRSLIDAAVAGDTNLSDQLTRQLYQLADERASFSNSINPFWDETETR